jgi:hypothetical protein
MLVLAAEACHSDKATGVGDTGVSDPAAAVLVTSDIPNFWKAYDTGGATGSSDAFQTEYLNRASPGLKDFIALRAITPASLVAMVRAYPRYFSGIRASTLQLANATEVQDRIRAGYR